MQIRWMAVRFLLLLMVAAIRADLGGSGSCGPYECRLSNPICRCESFCQEFSQRCWKNPSGCHCARGYARNERGHCVPLILCP
uniref:Uncharacterized protein, isoform B n=2 Tax=Drosophila melanogaster TaxID=7227 RepID=M9NFC6_DROME|nr:uncharacterized protein Dmel_CG43229, isoform B [Drosophila melanogaster]AFH07451.1 uncharacterized protein Dmel_CG43229, isoform B [Drosophila melanogaster]|eukprot:NP_001245738.1 uncharacterized protein Dmel_CG43229, isoform B [Drosophila melanogaster]